MKLSCLPPLQSDEVLLYAETTYIELKCCFTQVCFDYYEAFCKDQHVGIFILLVTTQDSLGSDVVAFFSFNKELVDIAINCIPCFIRLS